jgi:hypothetical protein
MIGRAVLMLSLIVLLLSLQMAVGQPRPVSAQDPMPTPVGQLGGPMPLPTAPGVPDGSLPQDTPTPAPQDTPVPARHPLVGTWLLTFAEGDQAPAQVVFGDDGFVLFTDAAGNQGAGVWTPRGEQRGILAVVVREADASDPRRPIMLLQGPIDVGSPGDVLTLHYTMEMVDGSSAAAKRTGPFTATGQRVGEKFEVPTPE